MLKDVGERGARGEERTSDHSTGKGRRNLLLLLLAYRTLITHTEREHRVRERGQWLCTFTCLLGQEDGTDANGLRRQQRNRMTARRVLRWHYNTIFTRKWENLRFRAATGVAVRLILHGSWLDGRTDGQKRQSQSPSEARWQMPSSEGGQGRMSDEEEENARKVEERG